MQESGSEVVYHSHILSAYTLDDAPEDVRELYKDEFIQLYASSIKCFFNMHQIGIYIGKE